MAILDDQGRLFGRVNLIDAAVALFVLALLPLAYGSWVLFRPRPPVIEEVTASVLANQPKQHIEVRGQNLRPFFRASVGGMAATFLYASPDRAQVELPPLAPGTYYLAFWDDSKEIVRLPDAVTVRPVPQQNPAEVELLVRFVIRPEVLDEVKRSQRERPDRELHPTTSRPVLVSYEVTDEVRGTTTGDVIQGRLTVVKCVVRVVAARTADGWQYDDRPLKAGASFKLTDETYVLTGDILSITVTDAGR